MPNRRYFSTASLAVLAFLALSCLPAYAVTAFAKRFRVTLKSGDIVDAYVTKPAALVIGEDESLFSALTYRWSHRDSATLAKKIHGLAASFIDAQSREAGHVNEVTRRYHERELWLLRSGRWPAVVITAPNRPEQVLLTVALAIAWGADPLPFQYRFYKRGIAGLPQSYGTYSLGMQNFFDDELGYMLPIVLYDKVSQRFHYSEDLSVLLSQLPWVTGRSAEIKFLMQRPGVSPELSAVAHTLITAFGLHRFAVERLPRAMRAQQVDFMNDPIIKAHFMGEIDRRRAERLAITSDEPAEIAANTLFVNSFFDALKKVIWNPLGFQRHSAVSTLYAQVSERLEDTRGGLSRHFLRKFHFPEKPKYDFAETAQTGTEGIQTKIYALTMENFDLDMMEGLNRQTQTLGEGLRFEADATPGARCPDLLIETMGATHREAFRIFKQTVAERTP